LECRIKEHCGAGQKQGNCETGETSGKSKKGERSEKSGKGEKGFRREPPDTLISFAF
jgi:hypothetical protein